MTATEERAGLRVPARVIPVPTSISPEAQAFLAMGPMPAPENPALDDIEGWRAMIAATNQMVLAAFDRVGLTSPDGFDVDEISLDGTTVYVITPSDLVRTHRALRAAGVPAELHVLEAAPHGFFRGATPEDRDLDQEVRRFISAHCSQDA